MNPTLTVPDLLTRKRACEENIKRTVEHCLAAFYSETGIKTDGVVLDVSQAEEPKVYSATISLNLD
jgi:hypothetical protein